MISKTHTKYIQSLHHKKFRDEYGVFIAEGPKLVLDLLKNGKFICKELLSVNKWLETYAGLAAINAETTFIELQDFELEKISFLATPHQVLAVFEQQKLVIPVEVRGLVTLVLETIQDPGNLGTIIRTADWFGIKNIICSPDCVEMYNPKLVQSTMGSLGRVNLNYTSLPDWMRQHQHVRSYACTLNGLAVDQLGQVKEGIFIIGNESNGISGELLQMAHEQITIPKKGGAESLNAAVAAGIIISQVI